MNVFRKQVSVVLVVACLGVVLAACGSSKTSSSNTTSAVKLTKSPIKILGTGTFAGTSSPHPQGRLGMEAAVDTINASGGIHGHPIDLTTCDDQDSPSLAASCAETAVADHDVAVVAEVDNESAYVIPKLQSAGIAFVGNIAASPYDVTSPISFPGSPGVLNGLGVGEAVAMKVAGCKSAVTETVAIPGITRALKDNAMLGLKDEHIPDLKQIIVPVSTVSFASYIADAQAVHAACILTTMSEPMTVPMLEQIKTSGTGIRGFAAMENLPSLSTLHGLLNGDYVTALSATPDDVPLPSAQKTVLADVYKYTGTSAANASAGAFAGFASVTLLKDALLQVHGAYTAKSVLAAMNHLTDATTYGIWPPYTTARPSGVPGQPREFNHDILSMKIIGNKVDLLGGFRRAPGL